MKIMQHNINNVHVHVHVQPIYTTQHKLKEHVDIMIFIERYPLKRCQGCVKLIASKANCFLNINDLSEVQLCTCPLTAGPERVHIPKMVLIMFL